MEQLFIFCRCIRIYVGFWYKNHVCEKINVYNTLTWVLLDVCACSYYL